MYNNLIVFINNGIAPTEIKNEKIMKNNNFSKRMNA